jgi:hypothetical protein
MAALLRGVDAGGTLLLACAPLATLTLWNTRLAVTNNTIARQNLELAIASFGVLATLALALGLITAAKSMRSAEPETSMAAGAVTWTFVAMAQTISIPAAVDVFTSLFSACAGVSS